MLHCTRDRPCFLTSGTSHASFHQAQAMLHFIRDKPCFITSGTSHASLHPGQTILPCTQNKPCFLAPWTCHDSMHPGQAMLPCIRDKPCLIASGKSHASLHPGQAMLPCTQDKPQCCTHDSPLLLGTHFKALHVFHSSIEICTSSLLITSLSATCDSKYLNESTLSNSCSQPSLAFILPAFLYHEHNITLLT